MRGETQREGGKGGREGREGAASEAELLLICPRLCNFFRHSVSGFVIGAEVEVLTGELRSFRCGVEGKPSRYSVVFSWGVCLSGFVNWF